MLFDRRTVNDRFRRREDDGISHEIISERIYTLIRERRELEWNETERVFC